MAVVYIGIGSNLGDKKGNCLASVEKLSGKGIKVTGRSTLYDTQPWGVADQPEFTNMVVEARTTMSPEELLVLLKKIEREMGRESGPRWGPRLIDLDLLLYDDLIIRSDNLVVPHPLLHKRDFVLLPLAELAPDMIHPVLGKKITDLKEALRYETDHHNQ